MKDILIVGGGVIGCSIARELARFSADVTLLEKGNDVSVGTSKANSGLVHAGHDAVVGSNKAKFNVLGNAMFDALSKELDFPFVRNGSMVLCFDEAEKHGLDELMQRGVANGVKGMSIISGEQARKIEPHLSEKVVAALLVESGGIVSPYEMTIAYAENACVNGVDFQFGKEVTSIVKNKNAFDVTCADGSVFQAKYVVNCAGVYADKINAMVCGETFKITARKGDYMLMDKACSSLCTHSLFQQPNAMGKGILVTPTAHGNILTGPTAQDVADKDDVDTTAEALAKVFDTASKTTPSLSRRMVITQYAGLRAHPDGDDFIIGESKVKGFYNVAGIESPGLTSAPAIAVFVADEISKELNLSKKDNFVAKREGIPMFSQLSNDEREKLIKKNPLFGNIVCRCEMVTEAEIVSAITRPLGAKDLDGIKRRTRAGMGRCQAGFCTPRIMQILEREKGISAEQVTKCGGNSVIVVGRSK